MEISRLFSVFKLINIKAKREPTPMLKVKRSKKVISSATFHFAAEKLLSLMGLKNEERTQK